MKLSHSFLLELVSVVFGVVVRCDKHFSMR